MAKSLLTTKPFGPFDGVIDTKGGSIPAPGKLRNAKNLVFAGQEELSVMRGSAVTFTFLDDAGTPAHVTSVLAVQSFMDWAVAICHSTATSKVYLYRLKATMDGWYSAAGALVATASPQPCAVLWSAIATAPDVSLDEGLGTLYVANTSAIDVAGLYYPTKQITFNGAGVPTVSSLPASGVGGAAGADVAHFTSVVAFHQHLWGIGYGVGAVAGFTSYRPELARFSQPSFGNFQTADSIVIGDEVRALPERPLIQKVAGNALFLGASKYLFRVTGYGRDSWFVETLSQKYGVTGPKAGIAVGNTFYHWTSRGLSRCSDTGAPQPLWDAIVGAVATVANESKIVLGFDSDTDRVMVMYDSGAGVRTLCAFDTRRDDYCSIDGDVGVTVACAGVVDPIYSSTATPPAAPAAPTIVSTSSVTDTSAIFTWSLGDALAQTEVGYRVQGQPSFTIVNYAAAGATSFSMTGLTPGVAYEWQLRALKSGQYSSAVGPTSDSQFTTTTSGGGGGTTPPAAPTGLTASPYLVITGTTVVELNWTNADPSLNTQVLRSTNGVSFGQVGSVSPGQTFALDDPGAYGTFYYEVRHVAVDGTLGVASAYATVTTVP